MKNSKEGREKRRERRKKDFPRNTTAHGRNPATAAVWLLLQGVGYVQNVLWTPSLPHLPVPPYQLAPRGVCAAVLTQVPLATGNCSCWWRAGSGVSEMQSLCPSVLGMHRERRRQLVETSQHGPDRISISASFSQSAFQCLSFLIVRFWYWYCIAISVCFYICLFLYLFNIAFPIRNSAFSLWEQTSQADSLARSCFLLSHFLTGDHNLLFLWLFAFSMKMNWACQRKPVSARAAAVFLLFHSQNEI